MDEMQVKLWQALRKEGFTDEQIRAYFDKVDKDIHERIVREAIAEGHTLEQAEAWYQQAKAIVEAEDREALLRLLEKR
jgi:hypothetical protein